MSKLKVTNNGMWESGMNAMHSAEGERSNDHMELHAGELDTLTVSQFPPDLDMDSPFL